MLFQIKRVGLECPCGFTVCNINAFYEAVVTLAEEEGMDSCFSPTSVKACRAQRFAGRRYSSAAVGGSARAGEERRTGLDVSQLQKLASHHAASLHTPEDRFVPWKQSSKQS